MTSTTQPELTIADCRALLDFIASNGLHWRNELQIAWETGHYYGIDSEHVEALQDLRNRVGPSCLAKITMLDVIAAVDYHDAG
jgi:hypothetical protein